MARRLAPVRPRPARRRVAAAPSAQERASWRRIDRHGAQEEEAAASATRPVAREEAYEAHTLASRERARRPRPRCARARALGDSLSRIRRRRRGLVARGRSGSGAGSGRLRPSAGAPCNRRAHARAERPPRGAPVPARCRCRIPRPHDPAREGQRRLDRPRARRDAREPDRRHGRGDHRRCAADRRRIARERRIDRGDPAPDRPCRSKRRIRCATRARLGLERVADRRDGHPAPRAGGASEAPARRCGGVPGRGRRPRIRGASPAGTRDPRCGSLRRPERRERLRDDGREPGVPSPGPQHPARLACDAGCERRFREARRRPPRSHPRRVRGRRHGRRPDLGAARHALRAPAGSRDQGVEGRSAAGTTCRTRSRPRRSASSRPFPGSRPSESRFRTSPRVS